MHRYLRMYRKQSHLTQRDIIFLLELSDPSNVSRWEMGFKKPTIEHLICYHLLFNIPVDALVEAERYKISQAVAERVALRLEKLKSEDAEPRLAARVAFLEKTLARLSGDGN